MDRIHFEFLRNSGGKYSIGPENTKVQEKGEGKLYNQQSKALAKYDIDNLVHNWTPQPFNDHQAPHCSMMTLIAYYKKDLAISS